MTLNLSKNITEFLKKHLDKKFEAYELAQEIFKHHPKQCEEKRQRSRATKVLLIDDKALIRQIAGEIGALRSSLQKKYPQIKTIEVRPRKYYYTEKSDIEEVKQAEIDIEQVEKIKISNSSASKELTIKEKILYSTLSTYLRLEHNIYSYRIDRSSNRRGPNGNKWLYPDIVGIEDLSADWHKDIKDCAKVCFDKKTKLSSYEVKSLINQSNIREVFFQTVSNSSWANLGYLVTKDIIGDNIH